MGAVSLALTGVQLRRVRRPHPVPAADIHVVGAVVVHHSLSDLKNIRLEQQYIDKIGTKFGVIFGRWK
jgi:hypothetical protein